MAKLTPKQAKAIEALLTEGTITGAAAVVRIERKTIQRWLHLPEFKAELRANSDAAIIAAAGKLALSADEAIEAIKGVMVAPTLPGAAIRLRAADTLLNHVMRIREQSDILERLAELEAAIGE